MAKFPFDIEKIIRLIAPRISTNTSDFDGTPAEKRWLEFSAGGMQITAILINVDDSEQKLLRLLDDADQKVMILATLYLGFSNDLLSSEAKEYAIQKVNEISIQHNKDQAITVACGVSLAQLGYPPAIEWADNQRRKLNISSLKESLRKSQEVVLYYLASTNKSIPTATNPSSFWVIGGAIIILGICGCLAFFSLFLLWIYL